MRIDSRESMEEAALKYGILPFFRNQISGFSIEEMTPSGLLFGGNDGYDGCWEWKGPVIGSQTTAYGKFFRRKAGFVALDLLPDFLNYRRNAYGFEDDSLEKMILDIIMRQEGATSAELRGIIFENLPKNEKPRRQVLEPALQRLQMGGHLLIADFEYKYSLKGERYGWGVALYSTPEIWLGMSDKGVKRTPQQSFEWLVGNISNRLPGVEEKLIRNLIK